jgi:hypothetical protein
MIELISKVKNNPDIKTKAFDVMWQILEKKKDYNLIREITILFSNYVSKIDYLLDRGIIDIYYFELIYNDFKRETDDNININEEIKSYIHSVLYARKYNIMNKYIEILKNDEN